MPQMAPLLWLNLMMMFIFSYTLFIIINYFFFTPIKIASDKKSFSSTNKNWKW